MQHTSQPVYLDNHSTVRFKANSIVRYLIEHGGIDLNRLACMDFSQEDRTQFAQLIGYSVCGFHELSYVCDEDALAATKAAEALGYPGVGCRATGCALHSGVEREES